MNAARSYEVVKVLRNNNFVKKGNEQFNYQEKYVLYSYSTAQQFLTFFPQAVARSCSSVEPTKDFNPNPNLDSSPKKLRQKNKKPN